MKKPKYEKKNYPYKACAEETCQKQFKPIRFDQVFCCTKCKNKTYWKTHLVLSREDYDKLVNNQK